MFYYCAWNNCLITHLFYIAEKNDREITYIGITTPANSSVENMTISMQNGAQLFLDTFNKSEVLKEIRIDLKQMSFSTTNANAFNKVDTLNNVIAIIGNIDQNNISLVERLYKDQKIPVLNNQSLETKTTKNNNWLYSLNFDRDHQAKFIANYTRNVLDKKIVTIVHANSKNAESITHQFTAVYKRFGTLINYTHSFDSNNTKQSINTLITEIKNKEDLGIIFIAGNSFESAYFIVQARNAGIKNMIVGTDAIGTNEFIKNIIALKKENITTAYYTHQLLMVAPLLFDTANSKAQRFKNRYLKRYGTDPDWVATYAYNAAELITNGLLKKSKENDVINTKNYRQKINTYLATLAIEKNKLKDTIGRVLFSSDGERQASVQVGIYEGTDLIAATTQLQPIKKGATINYIKELKSGKILYVNNAFMYKTDVIYTGIELKRINVIDFDKETAELDFHIWFRYKGKFNPADIVFSNILPDQEISLNKPILTDEKKGYSFRLYHIKANFSLNFLSFKRKYGTHLLGFNFTHKLLNKNNIVYVADVLGMDFKNKIRLKEKLENNVLLLPTSDWKVTDAWLSQGVYHAPSYGDPSYVGYNAIPAIFSTINYNVLLEENKFSFHNSIPINYYIYIGIFGLMGAIVARIMDNRLTGCFWLVSSLVIRIIAWPLIIISADNLSIEEGIKNGLSPHYIEQMILIYDTCLYLLVAILVNMAIKRFVFRPIENRTGHKVPGLIRYCVLGSIYTIVIFCIVGFIYKLPLGSLLAGSGVLAMIIGIAIQGNVANIFSGILLNIEKPFSIGDWVKIGSFDKIKIIDITWRSMHVIDRQNNMISIPNGIVAESQIINYSSRYTRIDQKFYFPLQYTSDVIIILIKNALETIDDINRIKATEQTFRGLELKGDTWQNTYLVSFFIENIDEEIRLKVMVLEAIYNAFLQAGCTMKFLEPEEVVKANT